MKLKPYLLAFGAALGPLATQAATITVNSVADSDLVTLGANSTCDLREAITAANNNADQGQCSGAQVAGAYGDDTIEFAIPGAGPHIILVANELPNLTSVLHINGYSQPGAVANSAPLASGTNADIRVVLQASAAPSPDYGLSFIGAGASGSSLRGVRIHGFDRANILLDGDGGTLDGVVVAGNFIGTDGSNALSDDTETGIDVVDGVTNATIGGPNDADRNLIAGNGGASTNRISVAGGTVQDVVIQGNLLSTNAAGTALVPANDAGNGILFSGTSSHSVLGNVIGGGTHGVVLSGTSDVMIQGNFIGANATPADIGGTGVGVWIVNGPSSSSSQNGVWSNEIANWSGDGIQVAVTNALFTSTGNEFMGNRIYGNLGFGIDLRSEGGSIGVTPNDAGDFDSGGNNLQNFPVINTAISPDGMNFVANYSLNGSPNTQYRIELFANTSCDASGYGQGERFLGATFATTDGSGNVTLNAPSFAVLPNAIGQSVTMTATNLTTGDTSEFSACIPITAAANGQGAHAIPALSGWGLALLGGLVAGLGRFGRRGKCRSVI